MPIAGTLIESPLLILACLAGFCPCPAVRTWPKITSSISSFGKLKKSSFKILAVIS
jgi:hypothetical protein